MKKLLLLTSAFMLMAFSGWSQKTVAGTVLDDGGLPLPGATVIEKGTSNGVSTDFDGNFSIEVAEDAVLEISFIGYATAEVNASSDDFNITLTAGNELDEVIVTTGYTTLRNKSFTGSAKIVTAENIATKNVTNITQSLAGEAAGIQVVNSTGQPGSASTIQIRGIGSVNGNTSPLIVLDGVAFNGSINSINPQDIETTTVLKDASATAIYGSRGANGVIVITTKSGSAAPKGPKKTEITGNQSYFVNEIASMPDYQNKYGGGFDQSFGWFFSNWGPAFARDGVDGWANDPAGTIIDTDGVGTVEHPYGSSAFLNNFLGGNNVLNQQYTGERYNWQPYESVENFFRS